MKIEIEEETSEASQPETKIKWNQTAVLELIDIWSEHDLLYNSKNPLYHNKHARNAALEKIVVHLQPIVPNITVHEVKTKINYLRSQYGRELLKMRQSQRSGIADEDSYTPSAYWYEHLHFLKDFVTAGKGKSNFSYVENEASLSEADDIPTTSKRRKEYDENSFTEMSEVSRVKRQISDEEFITVSKNYLLDLKKNEVKSPSPEDDFQTSALNFIRSNLVEIKDKVLRDELVEKIVLLIFEYKRKQRELT